MPHVHSQADPKRTLTCKCEDDQEDDDELKPDGEPLEAVQLPALAQCRKACTCCPCGCVVQTAGLLQVVETEQLYNPAEEDCTQQRCDRL